MLKPLTERQVTLIVNNVCKACLDISKLNKTGYKYINLASGFIAHYSLYGFIDYYSDYSLQADIERNQQNNQYNNFRPGEQNYDYYRQKGDIYNMIIKKLNSTVCS
jgi:hypothetical protein